MAILFNPKQTTVTGINGNSYDAVRAYAMSQTDVSQIVDELVQSYIAIAQTLGITPTQFIEKVESMGGTQEQQIYLASYLNATRVRNALLGVTNVPTTPEFILREIQQ